MRSVFITLLGSVLAIAAHAQDVVHLNPRGALKGQILEIDEVKLRLKVSLAGGAGSSIRVLPMERVKLIDFAPLPGEEALLAAGLDAPKEDLTGLWARERQHLARPNSNAGEIGLLLGEVLLATGDPTDAANARNLYTIVEGGDWDVKRCALAKRGRLKALVRLGAAAEVMAEAKKYAEEGDDPELLLDARHVLATADLEQLRELVSENPKWREDDLISPQIETLYHGLLDRFLQPFLFYGTEESAAARGLLAAAEGYSLVEQSERAAECEDDILTLYPETPQAGVVAAKRSNLKAKEDENTDTEE